MGRGRDEGVFFTERIYRFSSPGFCAKLTKYTGSNCLETSRVSSLWSFQLVGLDRDKRNGDNGARPRFFSKCWSAPAAAINWGWVETEPWKRLLSIIKEALFRSTIEILEGRKNGLCSSSFINFAPAGHWWVMNIYISWNDETASNHSLIQNVFVLCAVCPRSDWKLYFGTSPIRTSHRYKRYAVLWFINGSSVRTGWYFDFVLYLFVFGFSVLLMWLERSTILDSGHTMQESHIDEFVYKKNSMILTVRDLGTRYLIRPTSPRPPWASINAWQLDILNKTLPYGRPGDSTQTFFFNPVYPPNDYEYAVVSLFIGRICVKEFARDVKTGTPASAYIACFTCWKQEESFWW